MVDQNWFEEKWVEDKICDFEDLTLTCIQCHKKFIFSASEQLYFKNRGLYPRKRCKACADARRARTGGAS